MVCRYTLYGRYCLQRQGPRWKIAMAFVLVGTASPALEWRVVRITSLSRTNQRQGSITAGRSNRRLIYSIEREAGYSVAAVRTDHLQAAMSSSAQPLRVRLHFSHNIQHNLTVLQASGYSGAIMDMPFLSVTKPLTAAIQGHYSGASAS